MICGSPLPFTSAKGCSHGYNTNDIFNYITKIFMRCILVEAGPTAGEWNHSFIITNQHQGIWNVKRCSLLLVNKQSLKKLGNKTCFKNFKLIFYQENTEWKHSLDNKTLPMQFRNKMCFKDFHNDTNDVKLPNWVDAS